jgi:hypothetical protein
VFHDKFGYGTVKGIEGNKLTVAFDKAGEKKKKPMFHGRGPVGLELLQASRNPKRTARK